MVPPSSSALASPSSRTSSRPGGSAPRRPPLRVVPSRRAGTRGRRVLNLVALSLVVLSLLAVVVGQALLADGQVRLTAVEQQLQAAQGVHRQDELHVAESETPARIVATALSKLGLGHFGQAIQLPYVRLTTPLPTPTVTPAPAAPASALPVAGQ